MTGKRNTEAAFRAATLAHAVQRFLACAIAFVLVAGCVPATALADDSDSSDSTATETVKITFRDAYSAEGTALDSVKVTIEAGSTLADVLADGTLVLPDAQSYTDEDGTRHAFVGWQGFLTSSSTYIVDPLCIAEVTFNVTGAFKAVYVEVAEGQHLVTFKNEYALSAAAYDDGDVPSYVGTRGDETAPSKLGADEGTVYTFAGWYAGWAEGWEYAEDGDVTYAADEELPAVSEDAVYTARYTSAVSVYATRFSFYEYRESTGRWAWNSNVSYATAWGTNPFDAIADVCDLTFTQDGLLYTLIGWTEVTQDDPTPASDEPEYGVYDLPLIGSEENRGTPYYEPRYYAIYDVTDAPVSVVFMVGEDQYATLESTATSTLLSDAFTSTGAAEPTSEDGAFLGWAASAGASSALSGVVTVGTYADESTGVATFYAVFDTVADDEDTAQDVDISDATLTLSQTSYTYTGAANTPAVTVTLADGTELAEGTDYTVSYAGNVSAGTATATATAVEGSGYAGSASATFTVEKATMKLSGTGAYAKRVTSAAFTLNAKASVSGATLKYRSSKASVAKVSASGKVTVKGTGSATITVTATKANYVTVKKSVKVTVGKPAKPTLKSVKSTGKGRVSVKAKSALGITGYQIYCKVAGKKAKTVKVKGNKATLAKTLAKLAGGRKCTVKVRTYKKLGGKTYYSAYTPAKKCTVKK